jgi:hypothetical protein
MEATVFRAQRSVPVLLSRREGIFINNIITITAASREIMFWNDINFLLLNTGTLGKGISGPE